MGWSTWGLTRLADDAPRWTILDAGRNFLVRGVDEHRGFILEELTPRWAITSAEIPDTDPRPRPDDIVLWRAEPREPSDDFWIWGAPTRVLSASPAAEAGMLEVVVLQDYQLDDETSDEARWYLDGVQEDRALDEYSAWGLVASLWRLCPACPRCGSVTKQLIYGLPARPPGAHQELAGCMLHESGDDPAFACPRCHHTLLTPTMQIGARTPRNHETPHAP